MRVKVKSGHLASERAFLLLVTWFLALLSLRWPSMPRFLLPLLLCTLLLALSGCSLFHRGAPKPSAHLYEGDSPSLRFNDKPEVAGGAVNPY